MLRKSKNLALRARLEGSAPEVQVYWRRKGKAAQFSFFVFRSRESIVSARAEARARANVSQSVGPLLRIGSTSAPRETSAVWHVSSGSEGTSDSPSASRKPGLSRSRRAFVAWLPSNSYSLATQAKEALLTETPNPSVERTRNGGPRLALISFWAKPAPPPRAAHVKR